MDRLTNFSQPDTWRFFDGMSVLVTGGTGSFGRKFVATLMERSKPRRLVILSRDELKQYEMAQDLEPRDSDGVLRFFIGDVRDADRLEMALRGIDYVVHAAALKQVPTAEYNPFECIHTNVLGAENVVRAALKNQVKRVIALSTDKAVSPINLYGASKLASDKIFVAGNNVATSRETQFSVVRYGNVIGSRGSVVPLFGKLISQKADSLPITDPRMTRFWITLDEGVDFVASAFQQMHGGEVFVPKIPSMTIVDLAEAMAPGMAQRIVGIRPGEKLHEVMITSDDARNTIEASDRYIILPEFPYKKPFPAAVYNAQPVAPSFMYGSDTNDRWLTTEEMRVLLNDFAG